MEAFADPDCHSQTQANDCVVPTDVGVMMDPSGGGGGGAAASPAEDMWIEATAADGRVYYYHATTRQAIWERPATGRVLNYQELQSLTKQNPQHSVGVNISGKMAEQPYPLSGQHLAVTSDLWSGGLPNAGVNLPANNRPASNWLEYFTDDGRPYYFNSLTGETCWVKPYEAKNGMPSTDTAATGAGDVHVTGQSSALPYDVRVAGLGDSKLPAVAGSEEGPKPVVQVANKSDQAKPISSNPVAGTAWCVVWTGDFKVFYFNPTTRASVWERPPELYGRPDVDLLVSKPPEPKKGLMERKESPVAQEWLEMEMDMENESVEQQQHAGPAPTPKKKRKKLEAEVVVSESKVAPVEEKPAPPKPKDGAFEAELKAAQERAQIPLELRTSQFKTMLKEKDVSPFSTWEKELHKIVFDPRYLLLTSKERKEAFEEYVKERAEFERTERKRKYKEAKDGYQQLLEEAALTPKSTFSAFVADWSNDNRFKAIEKNRDREAMFDEHVRNLRIKKREEEQALLAKQKEQFLELLKERATVKKKSRWSEVKKTINQDSRYREVESSAREEWFREFCRSLPSENSDDEEEEARKERLKHKERKTREEMAQRAREKEVAAELESQMKERSREIEKFQLQEAEDNFKALLVDLIKATDQTWKDCKKRLRKDNRWESADLLDRQRKETLFDEHVQQLEAKYRVAFLQLLEETNEIDFSMSWKDVKRIIRKDPRYIRYAVGDRKCEKIFRDFMRDKLSVAKANFLNLLKETKLINSKSKQLLQEGEEHLKEILSVLENDKRYLKLESVAGERERLLESYLEQLAFDDQRTS